MPATAGEADGEPPSTAALPATKGRMGNCAVCDAGVPAKYRCPACSVASCSLACSKRHKISANDGAGCTGKRDRAAFKDIRDFTDADVVSDYRFLEEALLEKDRAKRWRPQHGSGSDAAVRSDRAPAPAKSVALVVQKAEARGVRLRRMPDGMTRRVANTTHYDRRRDLMRWRVEWLFRAPAAASGDDGRPSSRQGRRRHVPELDSAGLPVLEELLHPRRRISLALAHSSAAAS